MKYQLTKVQVQNNQLLLTWHDGSVWEFPLTLLRDECPCAGCKGETILLRTYKPAAQPAKSEDSYKISGISPVGGYALQISWKDGHNTGLYSWEYLAALRDNPAGT